MNGGLRMENVTRRFGSLTAVDRVTFEIADGETFSILGPSGCGKTTLLRILAGLEIPDEGRIFLDGAEITRMPPNQRPVNTVFQSYALFPHLSVRDNIAFGPRLAGWQAERIRREVDRMLAMVDLEGHADHMPARLSGGQKQRVALVRALVNRPKVLLLDEPLAALDLKLRQRLLVEMDSLHRETGTTFVYVTHDQSEAMSISDRIAVMNRGVIEQVGSPAGLYETPCNSFVASFIGDTNLLHGTVSGMFHDGGCACDIDGVGEIHIRSDPGWSRGSRVSFSLRPEKTRISRRGEPLLGGETGVDGVVETAVYFGSGSRVWVRCGGLRLCGEIRHSGDGVERPAWRSGERVRLIWRIGDEYPLADPLMPDGSGGIKRVTI